MSFCKFIISVLHNSAVKNTFFYYITLLVELFLCFCRIYIRYILISSTLCAVSKLKNWEILNNLVFCRIYRANLGKVRTVGFFPSNTQSISQCLSINLALQSSFQFLPSANVLLYILFQSQFEIFFISFDCQSILFFASVRLSILGRLAYAAFVTCCYTSDQCCSCCCCCCCCLWDRRHFHINLGKRKANSSKRKLTAPTVRWAEWAGAVGQRERVGQSSRGREGKQPIDYCDKQR